MSTRHQVQRTRARIWSLGTLFFMACAFSCILMPNAQAVSFDRSARSLAHYMMGIQYDLLGLEDESVAEYVLSVQEDPQSGPAHLRLGMLYAQKGDHSKAVEEMKSVIALDPQDLQARYFLALLYSAKNDLASASREYEVILKSLSVEDPRNVEIFVYLGQLYYAQGEGDKAIEQFEKALKMAPRNTGLLYAISGYDIDKGRSEKAEGLLKQCIDIDPMHGGCLNSLSFLYAGQGKNLDEALSLATQAVAIRPDSGAYLDTLGWVYYQKGLYAQALEQLSRAEALEKDPEIYDHLGDTYYKLGQNDLARKYWLQSLEGDPDRLSVRSKLTDLDKLPVVNQK